MLGHIVDYLVGNVVHNMVAAVSVGHVDHVVTHLLRKIVNE